MVRLSAYWCFIVLGIGGTLLGPALSSILADFKLTPADAGQLFFASALGYLIAVLVGGPSGDHWDRRIVLLAGAALMCAGFVAVFIAPIWILVVIAFVVAGLGSGVVDSSTNAMINDISASDDKAREQSLLHASFGFGALLGPLVIGATLALNAGWRPAYACAAVGAFALVVLFARLQLPARPESHPHVNISSVILLALNPFVLLLALMMGAYVGAELLLGDWSATYMQRIHHLDKASAATSVSLYWGGLAVGRLLSAYATKWFTGRVLLVMTCVLSLVASSLLVVAPNVGVALFALALSGIGYAAVFPLVMAVAGEVFPEVSGSIAGLLIGAASIFGAAVPWLGGIVVQYSDARAAMALSIPATVIMVIVAVMMLSDRPIQRGVAKTMTRSASA